MKKIYYREEFILSSVKNKKTLSIGLGGQHEDVCYSFNLENTEDVSFTISSRIADAAKSIDFIDISSTAIELFQQHLSANYFNVDITSDNSTWPESLLNQKYDAIVLGEVLEHVDCPGLALRNLKTLLKDDGELIITVPNAFFISGLIKTMLGEEFIHPEHVCYYSPKTLSRLLHLSGLEVYELAWSRWSRFDKTWLTKRLPHLIAHISTFIFPSFSEGVVAVARIAANDAHSLP